MLNRRYTTFIKILIFLSLGFFFLFKGKEYFDLSTGVRKILIVLFFLFASLRIFEAYQMYKTRRETERMKF
ncbi:MAG: hypothetical protein IPI60_00735 [Saprospiraceae bacterium]|nr:hypothetical protein [Saprospiraceae bacterium]